MIFLSEETYHPTTWQDVSHDVTIGLAVVLVIAIIGLVVAYAIKKDAETRR